VLNKADILDTVAKNDRMAQVEAWGEGASWMQRKPLLISAAASQGLDALREAVWRQLEAGQSS
jgi:predicted GTPase